MAQELQDIEPLRPLLSHRPLAILSDIDGTVAPIVKDPDSSRITLRARRAFQDLIAEGVQVGFVTGRALEKARAIVDLPDAYFGANHGLNIYANGSVETPESVRRYVGLLRKVLEEIGGIGMQGLIVEDKGMVVAFHYRMAPDEPEAEAAIKGAIARSPSAKAFRVYQGRRVIELRPPLDLDKGTAVADLARRMGAASVITMGDDLTDLDMFRGTELLMTEGIPGARIAVRSAEVGPEFLEEADYWVRGVEGVEWLLEEVLTVLRSTAPASP